MEVDIRGCGTALVTPFRRDGSLDEDALRRLVRFQLNEGIDFLVPCGTTGETPTLEHGEYLAVIRIVMGEVAGKVPVIAGVGGNNTRKVADLAAEVSALGVQGIYPSRPITTSPRRKVSTSISKRSPNPPPCRPSSITSRVGHPPTSNPRRWPASPKSPTSSASRKPRGTSPSRWKF